MHYLNSAPFLKFIQTLTGINETLLGDPSKAKEKLGWVPQITVEEMCAEMVKNDLAKAKQHALLKAHGYSVSVTKES